MVFRDEPQLFVFEHRVVPELLERNRPGRTVRVWCAEGGVPEALGVAMVLHRSLGARVDDWTVEVVATALEPRPLPVSSLAGVPEALRRRYFRINAGAATPAPDLARLVRPRPSGAAGEPGFDPAGGWDAIFARGTELSGPRRPEWMAGLADRLAVGGVLVVGRDDEPLGQTGLEPVLDPDCFCWVRSPAAQPV